MSNVTPIQFLAALYPEPVAPGSLLIWTKSRRSGKKESLWTRSLDEAARLGTRWRRSREVYFAVALHDEDAAVAIAKRRNPRIRARRVRGSGDSATLVPALWADLDVAGPGRAASGLPPDRHAALDLLEAVRRPPSIVVDSGGGYHLYWLFERPLMLESTADRRDAVDLVRRLQGALVAAGAERGYQVGNTADLARMMRLPGTFNYKLEHSRPVVVDRFPLPGVAEARYRLRDFRHLPAAPEHDDEALLRPRRNLDTGPPADFEAVYRGCSWLRHCYRERTVLSEAEWDAALTVVVYCAIAGVDGRRLAHRMSRDHPGYDVRLTDLRVDRALDGHGPRSCARIAGLPGVETRHCRGCSHRARASTPIALGRPPVCDATPIHLVSGSDRRAAGATGHTPSSPARLDGRSAPPPVAERPVPPFPDDSAAGAPGEPGSPHDLMREAA